MEVCLASAYLAPVNYYAALMKADKIFLENCDYYTKQTYRNRCRIITANGPLDLIIPVEKVRNTKQLTRDVKISNCFDWQLQHLRAIQSAYNSSPFLEYYEDEFLPFYEKKWNYLWEFNFLLQQKICELIDFYPELELTKEYKKDPGNNIVDLREKIHPKTRYDFIEVPHYYQVFEQKFGFIPCVSIIDLLFNMGNESILVLNNT